MIQGLFPVTSVSDVAESIVVFRFRAPEIASLVRPGQFVNVRVEDSLDPLLRRPFSVSDVTGDEVHLLFSVVGKGTKALRRKSPGETLDVVGPLGVPFAVDDDSFETAVLVAGGLGVAPLPLLTRHARRSRKRIVTFLGARSATHLVTSSLENLAVATEDGSTGIRGTVLTLLEGAFAKSVPSRPKVFACGPTAMLKAVAGFCAQRDLPCEVSLEGSMACGIGICQGCPVELREGTKKYALMCKDGPVFDSARISL